MRIVDAVEGGGVTSRSLDAGHLQAKLGLISLDFDDLEELYAAARQRDFGWVEVFLDAIGGDDDVEWMSRQRAEHGIRVASVSSLAKLSLASDEELPGHVALVDRSIRLAARLDAPFATFMYGSQSELGPAASRDRFLRRLEPLVEVAAEHDVTLLIENVFSRGSVGDLDTVEAIIDLFERVDSKHVGLNFDPGNLAIAGAEGYPHGYQALRRHIRSIHLKDARLLRDDDGPLGSRRIMEAYGRGSFLVVPLGEGDLDIAGLLKEIRHDRLDVVMSFEPTAKHEERERWLDASLAVVNGAGIVSGGRDVGAVRVSEMAS